MNETELLAALARLSAVVDKLLQGRASEREIVEAQMQAKLVLEERLSAFPETV